MERDRLNEYRDELAAENEFGDELDELEKDIGGYEVQLNLLSTYILSTYFYL